MHQNLHGLAAEEERGDAATAMRGHGDEVAAAGTSGFDDGLIRLPMLYFHHLTRDADLLGLLLCLGEVRFGLSMGTVACTQPARRTIAERPAVRGMAPRL